MHVPLVQRCLRACAEGDMQVLAVCGEGAAPHGARHGGMLRLIVAVSGVLRLETSGQTATLRPGWVAAVRPHAWFRPGGRGRFLNLAIREHGLDLRLMGVDGGKAQVIWHGVVPQVDAATQRVFALIDSLLAAGAAVLELKPALRCALHWIARRSAAALPFVNGVEPWLRVVDAVREHLDLDLDRRRVAAALGWHPNHLSRVCREHGGETFTALALRLRLERAEALLRRSDLSVLDIARCAGFASPQYFCRCFRRRHGCTPTRWRQASMSG